MSIEYKILIAEDDEQLAKKLSQFLSSWSYKVRRIENFEQVLDEFKEFDPDLVLMDVYLPYLNGHAWTHQIRQISNVPVLFLSSADDTSNMLTAFGQGEDDYICKPFELSVLAAKIKAMLHRAYDFSAPPSILEK